MYSIHHNEHELTNVGYATPDEGASPRLLHLDTVLSKGLASAVQQQEQPQLSVMEQILGLSAEMKMNIV